MGKANKKLFIKVLQIEMNALKGGRGNLKKGKGELIYGFKLKPKDEKKIVMQGVGIIFQRAACLWS